jgi:hypothetical protein
MVPKLGKIGELTREELHEIYDTIVYRRIGYGIWIAFFSGISSSISTYFLYKESFFIGGSFAFLSLLALLISRFVSLWYVLVLFIAFNHLKDKLNLRKKMNYIPRA